jgi:hypothetical protein
MTPGVDRPQARGMNVMGMITAEKIWLHKIEVRVAAEE